MNAKLDLAAFILLICFALADVRGGEIMGLYHVWVCSYVLIAIIAAFISVPSPLKHLAGRSIHVSD
jgi:hypothetical protein